MLGDAPQLNQQIGLDGAVINPTGTVYFTANSSSGSKFNPLNAVVFPYMAVESQLGIPSFSYINIDNTTLGISTYGYTVDENSGTYTLLEIDSYRIVKDVDAP